MPYQESLPGIRKGNGRPRIKSERLDMRVSPEEKARLLADAKALGVSVSAMLLGLYFGDALGIQILRARAKKR